MVQTIQTILPYTILASHVVLVIVFLAVLGRKGWGKKAYAFLSQHALLAGLLISLAAIGGSLFYSEAVGYEPCILCWWQRVFLYPQVILFAIALKAKERTIFAYSAVLALFAGVVALYHSYVYMGGTSILPCTALGGACDKIYVMAFGYITIPSMSLTIVLYLLLLAWINRLYQRS